MTETVKAFTKRDHATQAAVSAGVGPDGIAYVDPAAFVDADDTSSLVLNHNFATTPDQTYTFDCSGFKTMQIEVICASLAGVLNATLTYTYALTAAGPTATYGVGPTTLNSAGFSTIVDFVAVKGKLLKISVAKVGVTGGTCAVRISGRW